MLHHDPWSREYHRLQDEVERTKEKFEEAEANLRRFINMEESPHEVTVNTLPVGSSGYVNGWAIGQRKDGSYYIEGNYPVRPFFSARHYVFVRRTANGDYEAVVNEELGPVHVTN